jgi:glutamate mutase epsilon subunit
LDEARLRELHQRYQAAREQTKSGGPVSLEKLAQNLRETEAKLRAQHQGRKVDFDIVIKDGKAVIKPKLT